MMQRKMIREFTNVLVFLKLASDDSSEDLSTRIYLARLIIHIQNQILLTLNKKERS